MTSTCRHCGERIVLVNWSMGPGWTHQPEGAAFQDRQHVYCHVTRAAEPVPEPVAIGDVLAELMPTIHPDIPACPCPYCDMDAPATEWVSDQGDGVAS